MKPEVQYPQLPHHQHLAPDQHCKNYVAKITNDTKQKRAQTKPKMPQKIPKKMVKFRFAHLRIE